VELGTHKGTSFFAFCQAAKDGELKTKLYAIDTWKGDEHAGFYGEEIFQEVTEIKDKFYGNCDINLSRKTFDEALQDFNDESIDILHIDGLHTYEAVKHDFENWLPKVKKDGIVLLHDVFVRENNFGVYRFWEELKDKYETIEFQLSFGLGVLFVDSEKSKEFQDLGREWQMRYSYKADIRKNQEIQTAYEKINKMKERLEEKTDSCRLEVEEATVELNRKLKEKEKEVEMMKSSKFWKLRNKYLGLKRKIKMK
jgi:hypothetical protein